MLVRDVSSIEIAPVLQKALLCLATSELELFSPFFLAIDRACDRQGEGFEFGEQVMVMSFLLHLWLKSPVCVDSSSKIDAYSL